MHKISSKFFLISNELSAAVNISLFKLDSPFCSDSLYITISVNSSSSLVVAFLSLSTSVTVSVCSFLLIRKIEPDSKRLQKKRRELEF